VKNYQHYGDHLYLRHQDQTPMMGTEMVPETSVFFSKEKILSTLAAVKTADLTIDFSTKTHSFSQLVKESLMQLAS
jgi:hypothetical protein